MWLYNGFVLDETMLTDFVAFVYRITNLKDGRVYIGKKRLKFTSHKKLKSRKRRIKVVKESDWREYWGSSEELQQDVSSLGEENFKREILRLCKSLSESNYYELREQMVNDVLLKPDLYYNAYCGGRISRRQLGVK